MLSLVTLFATSALVLLQFTVISAHIIDAAKINNNQLSPNEIPAPRRGSWKTFVHIDTPLPVTTTYTPGIPLVIPCVVMGNPAPTVAWLKNGIPISDFEEETNVILSMYPVSHVRLTSKLVVTTAVDGDVFTCVAVSGLKETSASTTIFLESVEQSELPLAAAQPVITEFYNHVIQAIGTSLTLPCRVHSTTQYQLLWLQNAENVIYDNPRMRVLPSGDLHINSLVWEDMGEYTCTVKNMYGKDTAATFLYPNKP